MIFIIYFFMSVVIVIMGSLNSDSSKCPPAEVSPN